MLTPYATFARNTLKAKSAGVVYPTIPGIAENGVAIVNAMKKVGLSVRQVAYDPNSTDLVGPITGRRWPERRRVRPPGRRGRMRQHGEGPHAARAEQKVLTNPLCLDPRVAAGLGGDYPKWTFAIASSLGST